MNEILIRGSAFAALITLFAALEALFPARARAYTRGRRWPTNLLLGALDAGLLRLAAPLLAVSAALAAESRRLGLFNHLGWPGFIEIPLTLVLLDAAIYGQHRLFHLVPVLWRIHRVHHADRDVDVTTALRFHPFEQALSAGIKVFAVLALGAPALAVLAFEIGLNGMALFNHANLALPAPLDRLLRRLLVTPDMHRLHHAVEPGPRLPNYGFCLSLWDRAFASYADPAQSPPPARLGLADAQDDRSVRLFHALTLPFAPQNPLDSTGRA
jgi:sterol desaturase/sphingolipid hydroxylase (fatty acid hydroxylase superfamily)